MTMDDNETPEKPPEGLDSVTPEMAIAALPVAAVGVALIRLGIPQDQIREIFLTTQEASQPILNLAEALYRNPEQMTNLMVSLMTDGGRSLAAVTSKTAMSVENMVPQSLRTGVTTVVGNIKRFPEVPRNMIKEFYKRARKTRTGIYAEGVVIDAVTDLPENVQELGEDALKTALNAVGEIVDEAGEQVAEVIGPDASLAWDEIRADHRKRRALQGITAGGICAAVGGLALSRAGVDPTTLTHATDVVRSVTSHFPPGELSRTVFDLKRRWSFRDAIGSPLSGNEKDNPRER